MKLKFRKTVRKVIAKRITAPETRVDEKSGKRIPLLSFIDAGSYQQHVVTQKEIFLYAAGSTEEGESPDSLDRLLHHSYVIHLDDKNMEKAEVVGLDVIPNRMYRSGVVPTSQAGVTNLKIRYDAGGYVARVIERPPNTRFEDSRAIIEALDSLAASGKEITNSLRLGKIGRIVSVNGDEISVKFNASRRKVQDDIATEIDEIEDLEDVADIIEDAPPAAENTNPPTPIVPSS